MALHEAAQSVAWFVGFLIFVGALALWLDYRKEVKNAQEQAAKGTQPRGTRDA